MVISCTCCYIQIGDQAIYDILCTGCYIHIDDQILQIGYQAIVQREGQKKKIREMLLYTLIDKSKNISYYVMYVMK